MKTPEDKFVSNQLDMEVFREDLELFAWACEEMFHDQFRLNSPDCNEYLSRLPIAMLRMAAARAAGMCKAGAA